MIQFQALNCVEQIKELIQAHMNIIDSLRFVNKTMSSMHLCDIKSELFLTSHWSTYLLKKMLILFILMCVLGERKLDWDAIMKNNY